MRHILCAVLLSWVVISSASCTAPDSETVGPEDPSTSDAVAVVGEELIADSDILAEIEKLPPQHQARLTNTRALRDFVDNQATRRAMMQEARESGLADDPEIRRQVEAYHERLVMQKLMTSMREGDTSPSEEELRAFFDARRPQFQQGGEERSFEEAREDVERRFQLQQQRERHRRFVEDVREKRGVRLNDDALAALQRQLEGEHTEDE